MSHLIVSSYCLRPNTTIVVIGSADPLSPSPLQPQIQTRPAPPVRSEQSTIAAINAEMDVVRNGLVSGVDNLLAQVQARGGTARTSPQSTRSSTASQPTPAPQPEPPSKWVALPDPDKEHSRLAELLLQSLLRLDAISADGGWDEARKMRKEAVREVQGLLDRLDLGWSSRVR